MALPIPGESGPPGIRRGWTSTAFQASAELRDVVCILPSRTSQRSQNARPPLQVGNTLTEKPIVVVSSRQHLQGAYNRTRGGTLLALPAWSLVEPRRLEVALWPPPTSEFPWAKSPVPAQGVLQVVHTSQMAWRRS